MIYRLSLTLRLECALRPVSQARLATLGHSPMFCLLFFSAIRCRSKGLVNWIGRFYCLQENGPKEL